MRVWLIETERCEGAGSSVEPTLRALTQQPALDFVLVGVSPFRADAAALLRSALLHALVINTHHWDMKQSPAELLSLDLPLLLVGDWKHAESWSGLAAQHSVGFAVSPADPSHIWCALWSACAAHARERTLRSEADRFQQRLNDRIAIEKAKGILMHRLGIPEEEAYQRLRVQSRRQRKQIREIAQSILDTELLLSGAGTARGNLGEPGHENGREAEFEPIAAPDSQREKLGNVSRSSG